MNAATLEKISAELGPAMTGRIFGKIFQLSRFELAIDLRIADSRYLFISIEPSDPRIYLIRRRLKDLERSSGNPSPFVLTLRKRLAGSTVDAVDLIPGERIIEFQLSAADEFGDRQRYGLIVQLTGRSANMLLLDDSRRIIDVARETAREGQMAGDIYLPPTGNDRSGAGLVSADVDEEFGPSEALDAFYLERKAEHRFQSVAAAARNKLAAETARRRKLVGKLRSDLAGHGVAEQWKRYGDLLLANVATARREGGRMFVTDYYDTEMPEISLEIDENTPVTEAAEKYFKKYAKARRAADEIASRLKTLDAELNALENQGQRLEQATSDHDEEALAEFAAEKKLIPIERPKGKRLEPASGSRSFISSDGFEMLVGKKAKDNDQLTFRIAKSFDLWMHAADYPGSHVVVRNPNRKVIPPRTLIEAAQLAAFYSQGKSQPKAAVHYTQKKFVNKPKGAAAGLVSLASFKTILVVPEFPVLPAQTRAGDE